MSVDQPPRLSRRKRLIFAACAIVVALGVPVAGLLAIDVRLHYKYERSAGFNVWGYRGPIAGPKRAGEIRIAAFGGSTTFGYGVNWSEAFPAVLERDLAHVSPRPVSVVNLAYNNEGAYADRFTMQDYRYLHADLALLYSGYNDLIGDASPNFSVYRHDSPVFRLFGYMPIFPMVFREKAAIMLRGEPGGLYQRNAKTVFRPGLVAWTKGEILNAAANVGDSLQRQFAGTPARPAMPSAAAADATGCAFPWTHYCAAVLSSIEYALGAGQSVLVVTPPYELGPELRARHAEQQTAMAEMVSRRFGSDARVLYVNLGEAVDLADVALSYDRMHLTAEGNRRIAAALVTPVMQLIVRRGAP
jgi:hypothetical protein